MTIYAKLAFVGLLLLFCCPPSLAQTTNPCSQHQDKRIVHGPEPEARVLYKAACLAHAGPWPDGFINETFSYIGELRDEAGNRYKFGFLYTVWGKSGRATNRLLIFNANGTYLGRFSDQLMPPKVEPPYNLKYPYSAKYGNTISFKNGIPSSTWINGEIRTFEKAHNSMERIAPADRH